MPVAALAPGQGVRTAPFIRNRVLLVLLLAAVLAAAGLAFVSVAPNRLVSGVGVRLHALTAPEVPLLWLPLAALVLGMLAPPTRLTQALVAAAAAIGLAGLTWLAGREAALQATQLSGLARVSLGGAFWIMALLAWLAAADAVQRLGLSLAWRSLLQAVVLLPLAALIGSGALDALSLLKEYQNRQDVFDAAALRHLQIAGTTLVPALLIGVPLGVAAARRPSFARPLFGVLNIVQTVPSIALFALLIAPLAGLGAALPGWGIQGIGLLPAVIALTLYALLPIVHGTSAGLAQVPQGAIDAGRGMGMTPRQLFWRVEVPLALPVLLSGLRVTAVQVIGLAVVAALIGAGGFGALVFQGLASSALDLVLLGVLPVVALAIAADALLALATAAWSGAAR
ncbi:MAG: ABC transporter permease [Pseudomonadota bacterium]